MTRVPFRWYEAARKLWLKPRMIEVKGQQDYGGAFSAMDDARGQPIILPASPMFFRDREAIAQALLERRIPSIAAFRENLEAGALISYGFDLMGLFYDIASYVQRLAGGAKPSDMLTSATGQNAKSALKAACGFCREQTLVAYAD